MHKAIPKRPFIPLYTDLKEYWKAANHTIPYTRAIVEKYGDVCEASFTGVKNYFIHDPEVIKEILTTQAPKMKRTYLFKAFRKFLGHGLFTSDGDYHKQQRRLIKPAFYPQRIESYGAIMVQCAKEETDTWKDGTQINIGEAMTRITIQVITKTMFGSGLQRGEIEHVAKHLKASFALMNSIIQNPFYVFCLANGIGVPAVRKLHAHKSELDRVIHRIIASYRKDAGTGRMDLLSLLMEAKDEDSGRSMTDEQIRDEVITFFIAGHETTTVALTWTWYLLGRHPEIAKQFNEEVQKVTAGRLPVAADYEALQRTRNIFRESLRLYPPAWTFAREPTEDVTIRDYHFPKGSVLWTLTYLVHHDPKYFEHPENFIPSRWEDEKMKALPKYAYFPFGGGNRMCIGEGFAWMEGVLVLATIASTFELSLSDKNFHTTVQPLFTLKPKDTITMTCRRV